MIRHGTRTVALLALSAGLAVIAAGCGGDDEAGSSDVSGSISTMAIWADEEQESFEAVIAGFEEQYPNVDVSYTSGGDNLAQILSTAVEGGNPPDVAAVGQPGLMADFAERGALQSIDDLREQVVENFGESVAEVGTVDGTLYGVMFKGANKSTVWYNTSAFEDAGVEPAETFDDLTAAATTLKDSGIPAYSFGGGDAWPLTDLFENIYIRSAGPEKYDQLARHEIPWTDQSVKDALALMAQIVGDSENLAGGTDGTLQTDFPGSVSNVLSESPKAAMVIEGDFVPGVVDTTLEAGEGFDVFDFPAIEGSEPAVVGGGDIFVAFSDSPATTAFLEYLTTPEAAEIWAERGGFSSPNKNLDTDVYPDELTQTTAGALAEAETFRFDLSDLQPASFGATAGQGMWKLMQDFVASPDDVDGIATKLEVAAKAAYAGG